MAFPDFNQIFKNHGDTITKQYGKTISVKLEFTKNPESNRFLMKRVVKEDMSLKNNSVVVDKKKNLKCRADEDIELQTLEKSLKNLENEFGQTSTEIANIYCLVSGRIQKVREYLVHEKQLREKHGSQLSQRSKLESLKEVGVVTWNNLEDLALKKPEDSPEFQVLIATKGPLEI